MADLFDTRLAKAAAAVLGVAVVVVIVVGPMLDTLLVYVAGVVGAVVALVLLLGDVVAAPTTGKLLWAAGLALLVAPVFVAEIPYIAIFGGLALLGVARVQRIREVIFG